MNDELNENEILLIDKLKEIGEDEDSIIDIAIIAILEEMVDDILKFYREKQARRFLRYISVYLF